MALIGLHLGLSAPVLTSAVAAEPEREARRTILIPEPTFMHPTTAFLIKGSARTVLVPVRLEGDRAERLPDFEAAELGREALHRATHKVATALLERIRPVFHRDAGGVIEFAEIKSSSPATAAVVFAPELRKRFEDTLGPELLVVIPNRFQVFLFPRHATNVQEFAPMIFDAYDATAYPVSPEVFEVTEAGLHAFGVFERP